MRRAIRKSEPTASSVHVAVPLGSEKDRLRKFNTDPPLDNLEATIMHAALPLPTDAPRTAPAVNAPVAKGGPGSGPRPGPGRGRRNGAKAKENEKGNKGKSEGDHAKGNPAGEPAKAQGHAPAAEGHGAVKPGSGNGHATPGGKGGKGEKGDAKGEHGKEQGHGGKPGHVDAHAAHAAHAAHGHASHGGGGHGGGGGLGAGEAGEHGEGGEHGGGGGGGAAGGGGSGETESSHSVEPHESLHKARWDIDNEDDDDDEDYEYTSEFRAHKSGAVPGTNGDNHFSNLLDLQQLVSGSDYEMQVNQVTDEDDAKNIADSALQGDPDYYRKAWAKLGQTDPNGLDGLKLDLGSGQAREPGHLGVDLFPYDSATVVHDFTMPLPFDDETASIIRLVNATDGSTDLKPILSDIQRLLMPGGQFHYEGPNEIYNYPEWLDQTEKLVGVAKDGSYADGGDGDGQWVKQKFTRLAYPDAATANDSEPRIGVAQYDMLPADALLAMDAMGYYWSDATSSGRGNRLHGYPSQGALVSKSAKGKKAIARKRIPILKINRQKQVVYGVVLSPEEADLQDDFMLAEDIEKTAHDYLNRSRVIGQNHEAAIDAYPVESYIAPIDFDSGGPDYGPQKIKKGAWVLAVKINDPAQWQKVLDGEYNGFSLGGFGLRDPME